MYWILKVEWYSKNIFSDIDIIIPVPLHQKKLNKRGFNQSEWFAKGLSIVFGKSIDTGKLFRIKETETQTRKKKYERWENVEGIFELFALASSLAAFCIIAIPSLSCVANKLFLVFKL